MSLSNPTLKVAVWASLACFSIATASAETSCTAIHFKPGASSTVVAGTIPGHGRNDSDPAQLCYSLAVSAGQKASISLLSGRNVAITIPGVGDASDKFEFKTTRKSYELRLFQLFPGGGAEPFSMRVAVSPR